MDIDDLKNSISYEENTLRFKRLKSLTPFSEAILVSEIIPAAQTQEQDLEAAQGVNQVNK